MDDSDSFGNWLKRRRRALDLTQAALADCAGCSVVTIRKFETDERRPSRLLAERLADCLQVPAAERERLVAFARQPERVAAGAGFPPPVAPALPMPPAATAPPGATLPAPLTPLIGREDDIAAVIDLLHSPGVRVVTLTGPGGTGKTRLAVAVGQRLADGSPATGEITFIDLTPIDDPAAVIPAIARALNVKDAAGRAPLDGLAAHLASRRALLILDNFEQIVDAAGDLLQLLTAAGGLKLIVTSRAVLRLYGEHEYPVSPLAVPAPGTTAPDAVLDSPAAALFVARSRAANAAFRLTTANAAAVAQICARLDGLPLAIELAAARSKLLSPPALLTQLAGALDLDAGPRHAGRPAPIDRRQRTLRGAIDWSYRLLSVEEQRLFTRLGAFSGPFSAGAAAVVCGGGPLPAAWPAAPDGAGLAFIDLLASLLDKSMIQSAGEDSDGEPRFRLLVVLRDYALERLAEHGEADEIAERHMAYYLALAEHAAPFLERKEQAEWLRRVSAEYDDLLASLTHALDRPAHRTTALRLAVALGNYWRFQSQLSEGRRWLDRAIAAAPDAPLALMAAAIGMVGGLARAQDDLPAARRLLSRSLELWRDVEAAGDPFDTHAPAAVMCHLAAISYWREDYPLAERYWREALGLEQAGGNLPAVASIYFNLGIMNRQLRRTDVARRYYQESLALQRQVGNALSLVNCLSGLANLAFEEGHLEECATLLEEAYALAQSIDNRSALSMTLCNMADGHLVTGRPDEARRCYGEALALSREGRFLRHMAYALTGLAVLDLLEGRATALARPQLAESLAILREIRMSLMMDYPLYGVALLLARRGRFEPAVALATFLGERHAATTRPPHFQLVYDHIAPAAQAALDATALTAAEAHGRSLSLDDAVALALSELGDQ